MRCPMCEGEGGWYEFVDYGLGQGPYTQCWTCKGEGELSMWTRISVWFWENAPVRFVEWYSDLRYPYKSGDN